MILGALVILQTPSRLKSLPLADLLVEAKKRVPTETTVKAQYLLQDGRQVGIKMSPYRKDSERKPDEWTIEVARKQDKPVVVVHGQLPMSHHHEPYMVRAWELGLKALEKQGSLHLPCTLEQAHNTTGYHFVVTGLPSTQGDVFYVDVDNDLKKVALSPGK